MDEEKIKPPAANHRRVEQIRNFAWIMDELIRIPGTKIRLGLDALLGLIPGVGDVVGAGFSGYIMLEAAKRGAPLSVMGRMLVNILIEMLIGIIPTVGDLFDIGWKSNSKNAKLLHEFMDQASSGQSKPNRLSIFVAVVLILFSVVVAVGMIWLGWLWMSRW